MVLVAVFILQNISTNITGVCGCFKVHGLDMSLAVAFVWKIFSANQAAPQDHSLAEDIGSCRGELLERLQEKREGS